MRLSHAALIALCIVAPSGKGPAREYQAKPGNLQNETKSNTQRPKNPTPDTWAAVNQTPNQTTSTAQHNSNSNYYEQPSSEKWTRWLVAINAVYVVFSGLTFWAILKQAILMSDGLEISNRQIGIMATQVAIAKDAVGAAQDTAAAANKNADALINAERAWIIPELSWPEGKPQIVKGIPHSVVYLKLKLSNSGRTPAWIVGTWMIHEVADKIVAHPQPLGGKPETGPEPIAASKCTSADLELVCPGFTGTQGNDTVVIYG